MTVHRFEDLDTWKLADAFKVEVFALIAGSNAARSNRKFTEQLYESARGPTKHIAEGFLRKSPGFLIAYLGYAIGSLGEAGEHLRDGIQLGYWTAAQCREAFSLRNRCLAACLALKRSQQRYLREQEERRRRGDATNDQR